MNDLPCFSLSKRSRMPMHACALTTSLVQVSHGGMRESAHECLLLLKDRARVEYLRKVMAITKPMRGRSRALTRTTSLPYKAPMSSAHPS